MPISFSSQEVSISDHLGTKLFSGDRWNSSSYANISNGSDYDIIMIASGIDTLGVIFGISSAGSFIVSIYEETTVSANGTAMNSFNMNRNSSDTLPGTYETNYTPTVTDVGNLIFQNSFPGGLRNTNVGVGGVIETPIIMDGSDNYLLRINNNSGSARDIGVTVNTTNFA